MIKSFKIKIGIDEDYSLTGNSRIGGFPDLPVGLEYPNKGGKYYKFIAQINFKEFKNESFLLPKGGILQFFTGAVQSNQCKIIYTSNKNLKLTKPPQEVQYLGDTDYIQSKAKKLTLKEFEDNKVEYLESLLLHPMGFCYKGEVYLKMLGLEELNTNVIFHYKKGYKVQYFGKKSGPIDNIKTLLKDQEEFFSDAIINLEKWRENLIEFNNNLEYHETRFNDLICLASFKSLPEIDMVWGDMMNIEFYIFKEDLIEKRFENIVVTYAPS